MHNKVLIQYSLGEFEIPAEYPANPSEYSYSNVVNRRVAGQHQISWVPEPFGSQVLESYEKLKANLISGLLFHDVLPLLEDETSPASMVDASAPASWWGAAQKIRSVCNALGIHLCSYQSENDGTLFVHLVPQEGESASANKSRGRLRGHTDAVAMPFPHETGQFSVGCPSPDLVILACIRNPNSVATRVAPLSTIVGSLERGIIEKLRESCFDIYPQQSFSTPHGYKLGAVPLLHLDPFDGYKIRFSHSKIVPSDPSDALAIRALEMLQGAVETSYEDLILRSGDLLLLNNRTAIHGRTVVSKIVDQVKFDRWLMRTYGMHRNPSDFRRAESLEFVLGDDASLSLGRS